MTRLSAMIAAAVLSVIAAAQQPDPSRSASPPPSRPQAVSLADPLRELLAGLTPVERSRFFERHPGLSETIGWREPSASGQPMTTEQEKAADERERRQAE